MIGLGSAHWRVEIGNVVDVRLAKSWLAVGAILALSQLRAASRAREQGAVVKSLGRAAVGTAVPLIAVAVHEFGHAVVARRLGWQRPVVVLDPLTATTQVPDVPDHPDEEAAFAVSGAGANLIAAGITAFAAHWIGVPTLGRILSLSTTLNLGLALVNLVPAPPLDGGMALRAGLWHHSNNRPLATRQAEAIGAWAGAGLMMAGLLGWCSTDEHRTARQWAGMLGVAGGFALATRLIGFRLPDNR